MNSLYILTHLGLGDQIISNGLVRYYAKRNDLVTIFSKPNNYKNVSFMFRDLKNLKILNMEYEQIINFVQNDIINKYLIIGYEKFWNEYKNPNNKKTIDQIFYEQANLDISVKFSEFYVQRDLEKEKETYYKVGLKDNEDYIFIHDTDNRKITKEIPENFKIIKPTDLSLTLFDYLTIMENAKECHFINSSFFCLAHCMDINKPKMVLHEYSREDRDPLYTPILKPNWKIIK